MNNGREDRMSSMLTESGRRGFTLVELLIASAILAVLIIGVGFFFTQIIERSDVMDNMTRALELCRQGIEQYRTLDLTGMSGTYGPDSIDGLFARRYHISTPYTEYQDAKLLTCEVTWHSSIGPDTLTLSTIY